MTSARAILVVDGSLPNRYSTARVLTAAGFDVRDAATGREALRLAPAASLIVLDIALPDIDGFELGVRLKTDRVTRDTPIIEKTAVYRDDQHRHRGLALGADEYLTEPVDPATLVQCIQRLLPAPALSAQSAAPRPSRSGPSARTRRHAAAVCRRRFAERWWWAPARARCAAGAASRQPAPKSSARWSAFSAD